MMRRLFWLIVVVALAWSAYWVIGARTVTGQMTTWFEDRRAEGWAADVADITTRGFANRFDTTLTDIRLADPRTGVGWSAPFFQTLALAYNPTQVIAVWPNEQQFFAPDGTINVTSADMRASVDFRASTTLALDEAVFDLKSVALSSDTGWTSAVEQGLAAVRRVDGTDQTYDMFFEATNTRPGALFKEIIDPENRLPDVFETAKLDLRMTFDRPWDRFAVEDRRPQPTQFDLRNAQATWGALDVRLAGAADVDSAGRMDGDITVKVTNWRDVLALSVENGAIPQGLARTLDGLLDGLSRASGPANTLDVPISINRGQMRLGFIPLGPAPVLQLR